MPEEPTLSVDRKSVRPPSWIGKARRLSLIPQRRVAPRHGNPTDLGNWETRAEHLVARPMIDPVTKTSSKRVGLLVITESSQYDY